MHCAYGNCCCLIKDKQSQAGEGVNSREIRFPSEILHVLSICFSLPGCRWWKNLNEWLGDQIYCAGWSSAGGLTSLLQPLGRNLLGTTSSRILQGHVKQVIMLSSPRAGLSPCSPPAVALTNDPFVQWQD